MTLEEIARECDLEVSEVQKIVVSHFMPAGKPPPPLPLKLAFLTSSSTCAGVISKSALANAE